MRVIIHENLEKAIDSLEGDSFLMATWIDLVNSPVVSVIKRGLEDKLGKEGVEVRVEENKDEMYTHKISKTIERLEDYMHKKSAMYKALGKEDYFKIVAFKENTPKLVEMNKLIKEALKKEYELPKALEVQHKKNKLDFLVGRRVIKLYYQEAEKVLKEALEDLESVESSGNAQGSHQWKFKVSGIVVPNHEVRHLKKFLEYVLKVVNIGNLQLVKYKEGIPEEMTSTEEGMDLIRRLSVQAKNISRELILRKGKVEIPITKDYGGRYLIREEDSKLTLAKWIPWEEGIEDYFKKNVHEEEVVNLELFVSEREDVIHLVPVERWKRKIAITDGKEGEEPKPELESDNVRFIAFSEFLIERARLCVSKTRKSEERVEPIYLEAGKGRELKGESGMVLHLAKEKYADLSIEERRENPENWVADRISLWTEEKWKVIVGKEREGESWEIKHVKREGRFLVKPSKSEIVLVYNGKKPEVEEGLLEMADRRWELLKKAKEEYVEYLREKIKALEEKYRNESMGVEVRLYIEECKETLEDLESIFETLEKGFRKWSKSQIKEVIKVEEIRNEPTRVKVKIILNGVFGEEEIKNRMSDRKHMHILGILGTGGVRPCFSRRGLGRVQIEYNPIKRKLPREAEVDITKAIPLLTKTILPIEEIYGEESLIPGKDILREVKAYEERLKKWFKKGHPKEDILEIGVKLKTSIEVGAKHYAEKRHKISELIYMDTVGYLMNLSKGQLRAYVEGDAEKGTYTIFKVWD